jgi:hypothetical protein
LGNFSQKDKTVISKFIKASCIVGSVAFLFQAVLALFYGPVGSGRFVVAIIQVVYAFLLFSFLRRKRWSWLFVLIFTPIKVIQSILLPPTEYFYGSSFYFVQLLVFFTVLACAVIFILMLLPSTKVWFTGNKTLENISKEKFHSGEVLEITYRNNFWDIVWFNLYQTPRSRTVQISFILGILSFSFLSFSSLSNTNYSFGIKVFIVILILALIFIGFIALTFTIVTIRYVVRQFDIRTLLDCKLSVSASGVISETPFKNKAIKWSGIEKIQESSHYIMLFLSDRKAHLIPKRAFANKFDEEKFFDYSLSCYEKSKEGNSHK